MDISHCGCRPTSIAAGQHDCKYVSTVPEREQERKREGNTTAVGYLKGNYSTPTLDKGLITTQNYHLLWAPAYLKAPCHWLRVAFSFYLSQHPDISWLVMNTEGFFPVLPKTADKRLSSQKSQRQFRSESNCCLVQQSISLLCLHWSPLAAMGLHLP